MAHLGLKICSSMLDAHNPSRSFAKTSGGDGEHLRNRLYEYLPDPCSRVLKEAIYRDAYPAMSVLRILGFHNYGLRS